MRAKYFPAAHEEKQFHCPHCGVYAHQYWFGTAATTAQKVGPQLEFHACKCGHCGAWSLWNSETGEMVFPLVAPVELPHPDLPEECRRTYEEARGVFLSSPRAAAALLRLCVQQLMPHLGGTGANLNADIKRLVAEGLPARIQQALDICRVIGNNAVHPGDIESADMGNVAQNLFGLINLIVEDRIAAPRELEHMYRKLPGPALEQIEDRDRGRGPEGSQDG